MPFPKQCLLGLGAKQNSKNYATIFTNEFAYDFGKRGAGLYLVRIETANGVAVKKVSVTQ